MFDRVSSIGSTVVSTTRERCIHTHVITLGLRGLTQGMVGVRGFQEESEVGRSCAIIRLCDSAARSEEEHHGRQ